MRYITDTDGYVKQVSFGADIVCDNEECAQYTGSVPTGYKSLEAWFDAEMEKLYRWKIVSGHLMLDSTAVEPSAPTVLPVEKGGTGVSALPDLFAVTTLTTPSMSVKAQSYAADQTVTATKEGYTPLALAGFWVSGTNQPRISFSDVYMSGESTDSVTVNFSLSNWSTNYDFTGTVGFKVLWLKTS